MIHFKFVIISISMRKTFFSVSYSDLYIYIIINLTISILLMTSGGALIYIIYTHILLLNMYIFKFQFYYEKFVTSYQAR